MINKIKNSWKVKKTIEFLNWKLFLIRNQLPLDLKRGDWSLNIDDFEEYLKRIKNKVGNNEIIFLELGSGISTIIFGLFISKLNSKNLLISIEAEKNWVDHVNSLINKYRLQQNAQVFHVSYKQYERYKYFDKDIITEILLDKKIDVVAVDAPYGGLCPLSRKPAIPFLNKWLSPENIVFLHDAKRPDECTAIDEWKTYFKKHDIKDTQLGIAIFEDKYN